MAITSSEAAPANLRLRLRDGGFHLGRDQALRTPGRLCRSRWPRLPRHDRVDRRYWRPHRLLAVGSTALLSLDSHRRTKARLGGTLADPSHSEAQPPYDKCLEVVDLGIAALHDPD